MGKMPGRNKFLIFRFEISLVALLHLDSGEGKYPECLCLQYCLEEFLLYIVEGNILVVSAVAFPNEFLNRRGKFTCGNGQRLIGQSLGDISKLQCRAEMLAKLYKGK